MFQLKRFKAHDNSTEKNNIKVTFPLENLNLTNFVLNN
ncbi:MAG: hypothetical protein ACK52J_05345 [bacterium]